MIDVRWLLVCFSWQRINVDGNKNENWSQTLQATSNIRTRVHAEHFGNISKNTSTVLAGHVQLDGYDH